MVERDGRPRLEAAGDPRQDHRPKEGSMTADRYRSYRRALDVVAAIDPDWLQEPARDILEDLAEHMLLSADTSRAEVRELRENASRSVRELAGAGMLPPTVTEELIALLLAAGPAPPARQTAA
jgi:hypothetical protein